MVVYLHKNIEDYSGILKYVLEETTCLNESQLKTLLESTGSVCLITCILAFYS